MGKSETKQRPSSDDGVLRSMTGFGRCERREGTLALVCEVRTVNHKHCDVRVRCPAEAADLSSQLEEAVRQWLGRGRAEVTIRIDAGSAKGPQLNMELAKGLGEQLRTLRDAISPSDPVPWALVSGHRELFSEPARWSVQDVAPHLKSLLGEALADLDKMRVREGVALATDLRERCDLLEQHGGSVGAHRDAYLAGARARLKERIAALLEGVEVKPDQTRLEQEIAYLADRSDVAEELTRIQSHLSQLRLFLDGQAGGVGRKIDFLLQELGREVNTLGSKSPDVPTSHLVVEMKAELERMREQALNVL